MRPHSEKELIRHLHKSTLVFGVREAMSIVLLIRDHDYTASKLRKLLDKLNYTKRERGLLFKVVKNITGGKVALKEIAIHNYLYERGRFVTRGK